MVEVYAKGVKDSLTRAEENNGLVISPDSMRVLIGSEHLLQPSPLQLVMGTVSALVNTADLNLIGDPQIRVALLSYAGRMEQLQVELQRYGQPLEEYGADIVVAWQADTGFGDGGGEALGAWMTSRTDRRMLEAFAHLWLDGQNLLGVLQRMGSATDSLAAELVRTANQ